MARTTETVAAEEYIPEPEQTTHRPKKRLMNKQNGTTNGDAVQTSSIGHSNATIDQGDKSTTGVTISDAEVGTISSAHNIYRVKGKGDEMIWTSEYPEDIPEAAENDETAKFAVVVRSIKSDDSRRKLEAQSIIIQSPWLKKALGSILKGYPGVSCELQRLVFESPFQPFVHRWPELLDYLARDDLDDTTKEHLGLLIGILKDELRDSIKAFEDYLSKGITTFNHAWMLFQPGGLLVTEADGPVSVYELVQSDYKSCNGANFLSLSVTTVEWNGTEFGRYGKTLRIPEFKGIEKITGLSTFPLTFHEDKDKLQEALIERGKKFESLAGHHFKSYEGTAITWDREGREVPIHHSGRIVIDCKSFNRHSPCPRRWISQFKDVDVARLTHKNTSARRHDMFTPTSAEDDSPSYVLDDYLRLLCYSRVRGYSLPTKKWLDFYVPLVQEITWNTRAFDSLVLPEDQKELILAFTESQVAHRHAFDDVMKGKGRGIIILLSGKPGIGKTLTAESVAEAMKRPLHTISSGDLGTDAYNVERQLTNVLDLVGRWNAVLLLDECDVFLEARSTHDLNRNALVSSFLKTLEYYEGILFMTTNRADNIDPAFDSRIHVSMQYPDLTPTSRRRIWANFLAAQHHALQDKDLTELAEIKLNGRQIKNILKTSQLLASRRGESLRRTDVETVLAIENRRPEKVRL